MIEPPQPTEYAPYYQRYIGLVENGDVIATLENEANNAASFFSKLDEDQGLHRYAPDKWTIKEVLGHLIDTERIMCYRALRIARNDTINLPGFEQDDFVRYANSNARPLADLVEEFNAVRRAAILLFKSLDEAAWSRRGVANNNEVTVRALAYVIAGHDIHHRQILASRYLTAAAHS